MPKSTWGGRRDNHKRRPDDKRGGRRIPGPGKTLGRPRKDKTMKSYTLKTYADQEFDNDYNYVSVIDTHYEDNGDTLVIDVEVDEANAPRYEDALESDHAVISYSAA
jgi:hypothetical protein